MTPQLAVRPENGENSSAFKFPLAIPFNALCTNNSWQYVDTGNESNVALAGDFAGFVYGGHQGFTDYGYFDGISFGRTPGLPVTLAAWFTAPLSVASTPTLLSFGDSSTGASRVQMQVSASSYFLPRFINTNGTTYAEHIGTVALTAGKVYLGVLVGRSANDSQMWLFEDTKFIESVSQTATTIDWAHAGRLTCHARWNGSGFGLNGEGSTLLDVKVWNRALGDREIHALWAPNTRWQMYGVQAPAAWVVVLLPDPADTELSGAATGTATTTGTLTSEAAAAEFQAAVTGTATTTAAVLTSITCAAAVTATATTTAAFATSITCAAAVTGVGTTVAALTTEIRCVAAVTGTVTTSAALTTAIACAATATALATTTAALTTSITAQAGVQGRVTTSAALTTAITFASTAVTARATTSGQLDVSMQASATAAATVAAALLTSITAQAVATGTATTQGTLTTIIACAAATGGLASTTAALTTTIACVALPAAGVATTTANLSVGVTLAATASAVLTTTASLTTDIRIQSAVTATGTATGALTTSLVLAAAATGRATTTASLTTSITAAAGVVGTLTTTGVLTTTIACVAASTGQATTTGLMVGLQTVSVIADLADGTWTPSTGTDLFACVDEAVASDVDYIASAVAPTLDTALLSVGGLATPPWAALTVRVRARWHTPPA